MSKNIVIIEGGQGKSFGHVSKLKIPKSGGGDTIWVPEDEVQTQSLFVDKNGTYLSNGTAVYDVVTYVKKKGKKKKKAVHTPVLEYNEDNVCYGYDEVSVSIIDEVTGKDEDGNDRHISTGDNGYLQSEILPSYIEITTPPDKTSYIVAEPINTAGMVVTAYYADGSVYGEIPREEYTIDPIVAPSEGSSGDIYTNGQGVNAKLITFELVYSSYGYVYPHPLGYDNNYGQITIGRELNNGQGTALVTQYNDESYLMLLSGGESTTYIYAIHEGGVRACGWSNNKMQLNKWNSTIDLSFVPVSTSDPRGVSPQDMHPANTPVAVKWDRGDGTILTDSFEIEINNPMPNTPSNGDNGGGGSSGGSW